MAVGRRIGVLAGLALAPVVGKTPPAQAALFLFEWDGSDGHRMTGKVEIGDAFVGLDRVDESHVESFSLSVFFGSTFLGDWNLADGLDPGASAFNFNFNPVLGTLYTGRGSSGSNGQQWNEYGQFGFASGANHQSVYVNGNRHKGVIFIDGQASTLRTASVATPASLPLIATGLFGVWWCRRSQSLRWS